MDVQIDKYGYVTDLELAKDILVEYFSSGQYKYRRDLAELLEKIRQKIRENYKLDGNEHVTHLKNINNYIAQFQTKKDAKSPSQQEQQTDEFVKRLKEQFPAVTDGECKLATYIRLGLSAKEISLLTGTQINSIETYRHRLRKDLNLSPEQDLFEFLQTVC